MKIHWLIIPLFVMPIIAVIVLGLTWKTQPSDAQVYGTVPHFNLTDSEGKTLTLADLGKNVWVANFIFTSCTGQCPALNFQMRAIQNDFLEATGFKIVSFSVDPERDTPEVLANYAKDFVHPKRTDQWLFLTGDRPQMKRIIEKGFKVASGDMGDMESGPVTHSKSFVLVDRWGRIRGHFDGMDKKQVRRLKARIRALLHERY